MASKLANTPTAITGLTELLHSSGKAPDGSSESVSQTSTSSPSSPTASTPPTSEDEDEEKPAPEKTVFYLAYGSNLSSSTFKGKRGIKPLSATNVHVPSLTLTFSLPGIAYIEPCFANVCVRDPAALEPTDGSSTERINAAISDPTAPLLNPSADDDDAPQWPSGLLGVVYEVTVSDFATIIATEGGGASYADVTVPTYPIPSSDSGSGSEIIHAHTLLAPKSDTRSIPGQPSLRYINIIRNGAREHSLPAEYISYLESLQHYQITTLRQEVGRWLWMAMWFPLFMMIVGLNKVLAGADGRTPRWLAQVQKTLMWGVMWKLYDGVFKKIFGDGERTMVKKRREGVGRTGEVEQLVQNGKQSL